MSHHEAKKIKKKLAPFMSLLLAVACMGLLASCGGGGNATVNNIQDIPVVTSASVPVEKSQLDPAYAQADLKDVNSVVQNQYWVMSIDLSNQQIYELLVRKNIKIIGQSEQGGILIQTNSQSDIASIKSSTGISDVYNRIYVGENAAKNIFYWNLPNDGSRFDDGGDNWHIEYSKIDKAWQLMPEGLNKPVVGILDAGFFGNHEELSGNILTNISTKTDSHGTAVASVIAGKSNNGLGVSGVSDAKLAIANIEFTDISAAQDRYQKLIDLSKSQGQKLSVINNSWGFSACDTTKCPSLQDAIDKTRALRFLAVKNNDILHVFAAGNDGYSASLQNGAIHETATGGISKLDNVIVVTAINQDGNLTSYSPYGATVDIAAPAAFKAAKQVVGSTMTYYAASRSDSYGLDGDFWVQNAVSYNGAFGGTSSAAPVVSGVVALIAEINPSLTPQQIKRLLLDSATEFVEFKRPRGNPTGQVEALGLKIPVLNAEKAVRAALDTLTKPTVTLTATTTTPQLSQSVSFTANASSSNGAIKTYSWSFGDGTTLTGQTSPTTSHAFGATGDYAVTVTVMDEKGAQNTSTAVHIQPVSPIPTPTVTGITAPSTLTAGVNATFSINGTNLPTGENLVITPTGVGCTGFGYGTRSAVAHTFACTPSSSGSLSFSVSIASGQSLGAFPLTPFTVSGAVGQQTAYAAAQLLASNSIIAAQPNEALYLLTNNMSRAEAAIVLARFGGYNPTSCSGTVYSDVTSTISDSCGYIEALAQAGIFSTRASTFNPTQNFTRAEFVTVILNGIGENYSSAADYYTDIANATSSLVNIGQATGMRQYVNRMYEIGCGYSTGSFYPNNAIIRGDAFKFAVCAAKLWP